MPKIIKPSKGDFTLTDLSVDSSGRVYSASSGSAGGNYISASGGDETLTIGDYKIHVFKSSATLTVNAVGSGAPESAGVDYVVVGGGGGAGNSGNLGFAGGGGGGGYRASGFAFPDPLASGALLPVSASPGSYPITVGAAGGTSTFSNITSAGGGNGNSNGAGSAGASGGGAGRLPPHAGGAGNTPPVSPPQGTNGAPNGGGGAMCTGPMTIGISGVGAGQGILCQIAGGGPAAICTPTNAGDGGGAFFSAGGGGGGPGALGGQCVGGGMVRSGGSYSGGDGIENSGSGGAGAHGPTNPAGTGAAGIVMIRYRYQ
tara:strand:- start:4217 stop:5161 length:945 start_codon:yes stop_codon:yes gene_type:complete